MAEVLLDTRRGKDLAAARFGAVVGRLLDAVRAKTRVLVSHAEHAPFASRLEVTGYYDRGGLQLDFVATHAEGREETYMPRLAQVTVDFSKVVAPDAPEEEVPVPMAASDETLAALAALLPSYASALLSRDRDDQEFSWDVWLNDLVVQSSEPLVKPARAPCATACVACARASAPRQCRRCGAPFCDDSCMRAAGLLGKKCCW
jgi:hypothetical protein